jgi:hypothetical protein
VSKRPIPCPECQSIVSAREGETAIRVCLQCGNRYMPSDPWLPWIDVAAAVVIAVGALVAFYWIGRVFNVWR